MAQIDTMYCGYLISIIQQIETDCSKLELLNDSEKQGHNEEVERLCADNHKAVELMGWESLYGGKKGFSQSIKGMADLFTNPENLMLFKVDIYNL